MLLLSINLSEICQNVKKIKLNDWDWFLSLCLWKLIFQLILAEEQALACQSD